MAWNYNLSGTLVKSGKLTDELMYSVRRSNVGVRPSVYRPYMAFKGRKNTQTEYISSSVNLLDFTIVPEQLSFQVIFHGESDFRASAHDFLKKL